MGNTLKIVVSILLQAGVGYFLALYINYLMGVPDRFFEIVAAGGNAFGVWIMGFFLSGLNNHLQGIHLGARFIATTFGAFIGSIIVFLFGSTHWLEIPLIPLVLSLIGYHFIFFIKVRK